MSDENESLGGVIKDAVELVEEYVKPVIVSITDPKSGAEAPAYIDKDGVHIIAADDFADYLGKPRFRRGTAELTSLDSFIAHVERFKSVDTAVFACDDRTKPSMTAVLDYHPAGATSDPSFGRHRSSFKFPLSDEWKAWHALNGQEHAMGMVDFAQFLEDRIVDVEHPEDVALTDDSTRAFVEKLGGKSKIASPTKLLDLSTGLSINENSVIQQTTRLQSGEGNIVFQSEHTDGAGVAIDIPSMFVLAIPVFRNGPFYRVISRLRYRASTAAPVRFWYDLWRTDRVFDHAFDEACLKVNEETGAPVFSGAPE